MNKDSTWVFVLKGRRFSNVSEARMVLVATGEKGWRDEMVFGGLDEVVEDLRGKLWKRYRWGWF